MRSTSSVSPWRALLLCVLAFTLTAGVVPASAEPTNAAIEKKRDEASAAQAELDKMAT